MSGSIAVFRRTKREVADTLETFLVAPALVRRVDDNWTTVAPAQPRGTAEVAAHLSELLQTAVLWLTFGKKHFGYLLFENGVERDRFDMAPYPAYSVFIEFEDWDAPLTPEQIAAIEKSKGDPSALLPYCVNDPAVTEANLRHALDLMREQGEFGGGEEMAILTTFCGYFVPTRDWSIPPLFDTYAHPDVRYPPDRQETRSSAVLLTDPDPLTVGQSHIAQWYKDWELRQVATIPWAIDRVKELLADGANPNAAGGEYEHPLVFTAAKENNPDALRLFLAAGGDPDSRGTLDGYEWIEDATALSAAASKAQFGMDVTETVRVLLDHGATVNARDETGRTTMGYMLSFLSPTAPWRKALSEMSERNKQRFAGSPKADHFDNLAVRRDTALQAVVDLLRERGATE